MSMFQNSSDCANLFSFLAFNFGKHEHQKTSQENLGESRWGNPGPDCRLYDGRGSRAESLYELV